MTVSSPALREALEEVVGREHLLGDPAALVSSAVDGVTPRWVARPGDAGQVSRVLALATSERLGVAPRGSGSSLGLGNPPRRLDLVLDLGRLSGVTEYVPEDMVTTVEAGTSLSALAAQVTSRHQRLALDPPRGGSRTVGGVLATDASGPLRFRYGTARDLLLGVRFVQADGTITWGGSKVVKSVTGYDVPKLLVGSLGTLGVIVSATLRLHPLPPATGSWLLSFASREAAQDFLAALLDSSLEPERLLLLNARAVEASGLTRAGSAVLISIASVEEAVASQGAALALLASREGARAEAMPLSAWDALGPALDASVALRLACEPRRLVSWLGQAEDLARRIGLEVSAMAQAGSGVLHMALLGTASGDSLSRSLLDPLRARLQAEGGSLVVDKAPAGLKAHFDAWGAISPESLALMSRLKQEFDPLGILNPGRFVGGL